MCSSDCDERCRLAGRLMLSRAGPVADSRESLDRFFRWSFSLRTDMGGECIETIDQGG